MRASRLVAALVAAAAVGLATLTGCASAAAGGPRFVVASNPTGVWQPVHLSLIHI